MTLETKILKAGNGDAILIKFKEDNEQKFHNILVDGGSKMAYETNLKVELLALIEKGESLDLLIITHIDQDHIGGIINLFDDINLSKLFLKDNQGVKQFLEIKEIWFNTNHLINKKEFWMASTNTKISKKQGANLQLHVENKAEYVNAFISRPERYTKNEGIAYFGKLKITILAPNIDFLIRYNNKLSDEWNKYLKELLKNKHSESKVSVKQRQYNKLAFEKLIPLMEKQRDEKKEGKDNSPENSSSIAFLVEFDNKSILLLGDAPCQEIIKSLRDLGYSEQSPILVDYVKLSHHAGVKNTNYELLSLIDCKKFIISTDGQNHDLPNKATLAKIISSKGDGVSFYFNYPSNYYPFHFYSGLNKLNDKISFLVTYGDKDTNSLIIN